MKIRIRDAETREVLHVIAINADDDRRDDIVKQVIDVFDGRAVIVDDSDSEDDAPVEDEKVPADSATSVDSTGRVEHTRALADEAAAEPMSSLTGDGRPVDAPPGIPAEGTTT